MLNIIIVLWVLNFQCYRQVTHQINLEGICSLFESGGIETNVQLKAVQLGSTFLVFDKGKESGPTNVYSQPTHLHWSSLYLVVGWKCVVGARGPDIDIERKWILLFLREIHTENVKRQCFPKLFC